MICSRAKSRFIQDQSSHSFVEDDVHNKWLYSCNGIISVAKGDDDDDDEEEEEEGKGTVRGTMMSPKEGEPSE